MNLERLFELVFSNPENISIEYSNKDGKETLIVNGEDLLDRSIPYNDSKIKKKIADYNEKIKMLDDYIFEKVMDEAEERNFNLFEMNKGLELEHYTPQKETYANNVIEIMTDLIHEVISNEALKLVDVLENF